MLSPVPHLQEQRAFFAPLANVLLCALAFGLLNACESAESLANLPAPPEAVDAAMPTPVHAETQAPLPWTAPTQTNDDAGEPLDAALVQHDPGPPYPIVFVHGFSGFNSLGPLEYFFRVLDSLHEEGETLIFAPAIPAYNSIEARAEVLAAQIDQILAETGATKVHLIAHSQGGLDSRHVISTLGYADRVATLTTVATPHRGTPLADYVLRLPEDTLDPVARTLAWMIGALDDPESSGGDDDNWRQDMDASATSLATYNMQAYNDSHPDDPRVPIFSYVGVSNLQKANDICEHSDWGRLRRVDILDPLLLGSSAVLSGWDPFDRIPNDGIVPSASMVWGHFVGCIPADHFDQIGQIADFFPNVVSGFDHVDFYRKLVANIRAWELAQP